MQCINKFRPVLGSKCPTMQSRMRGIKRRTHANTMCMSQNENTSPYARGCAVVGLVRGEALTVVQLDDVALNTAA